MLRHLEAAKYEYIAMHLHYSDPPRGGTQPELRDAAAGAQYSEAAYEFRNLRLGNCRTQASISISTSCLLLCGTRRQRSDEGAQNVGPARQN